MTVASERSSYYAVLSLASVPTATSPPPLRWSQDGQLLIVTGVELNILTPALTFAVDRDLIATTSQLPAGPKPAGGRSFAFFRTTIPVVKSTEVFWDDHSNAFETLVPPVEETEWRSVTWSPSGLTHLGGCMIAATTNRGETLILVPNKNFHRDNWRIAFDLSADRLKELLGGKASDPWDFSDEGQKIRRDLTIAVLRTQSAVVTWSTPASQEPSDTSLLAVGHRAGCITLWSHVADGKMSMAATADVTQGSIVDLVWSSWTHDGTVSKSTLAIASHKGDIVCVDVVRASSGEVTVGQPREVAQNPSPASYLTWIGDIGTARTLLAHRTGVVEVHRWPPAAHGPTTLELPRIGEWDGASSWSPCSSIMPMGSEDEALVAISSGAVYRIGGISSRPFVDLSGSEDVTGRLRTLFRMFGHDAESGKVVTRERCMQILGAVWLDEVIGLSWLFRETQPFDIKYSTTLKTTSTFAIAPMDPPLDTEEIVAALDALVSSPPSSLEQAPSFTLQSPLFYLSSAEAVPSALRDPAFGTLLAPRSLPTTAAAPHAGPSLEADLLTALFQDQTLEGLRLRVVLASSIMRTTSTPEALRSIDAALMEVTRAVNGRVFKLIATVLSRRQSEIDDASKELLRKAAHVSAAVSQPSQAGQAAGLKDKDSLASPLALVSEPCPACAQPIPFDNVSRGTCESGHVWDRCSVTLQIVTTLVVRVCTCCGRKALPPPTSSGPATANGVISTTDRALSAARICLHCGGRWMYSG